MIKWVRLDERMIHGQVATKWSRTLGVDRIVVADDTAAASDIMQKSLMIWKREQNFLTEQENN